MKRRTFIRIATTASAALYFPHIQCRQKTNPTAKRLAHPQALEHLFDSKTIHEIGEVYQKQAKDESDETDSVCRLCGAGVRRPRGRAEAQRRGNQGWLRLTVQRQGLVRLAIRRRPRPAGKGPR